MPSTARSPLQQARQTERTRHIVPDTRTFLIAEDEAMIAMLLEDFLDLLGHKVVHMVATLGDGLDAIAQGGFEVAILDVNLGRDKCWPLADALQARGIAYIFATGGGDTIPAPHDHAPTLSKPYTTASLEMVLATLA